jgi:hypothetical protein
MRPRSAIACVRFLRRRPPRFAADSVSDDCRFPRSAAHRRRLPRDDFVAPDRGLRLRALVFHPPEDFAVSSDDVVRMICFGCLSSGTFRSQTAARSPFSGSSRPLFGWDRPIPATFRLASECSLTSDAVGRQMRRDRSLRKTHESVPERGGVTPVGSQETIVQESKPVNHPSAQTRHGRRFVRLAEGFLESGSDCCIQC